MHSEGIAGLWLFWCAYAISGFLPFVFAPLWAKLNFLTDNQFILFRFSGKGAKALHIFRTVYVGWIIVAFLMSFQLLALLKIATFITGWEREIALAIISILLIVIALKNKLGANIQLDFFNTILIVVVFIGILAFFIFMPSSISTTQNTIELTPIFPANKWNLLVLFFVQTWSVNLFDGSGVEAQRFFATKNKRNTWKVAILSSGLSLLFSIILVLINYLGANKIGAPSISDNETFILSYLQYGLPNWFLPIVVVAFFATFITSFEGLLNWGASFLTIDGYKTYINPKASEKKLSRISIISILLIVITSLGITYFSDSITSLIKILFSISAGVAPVFVLRWFWMRINAWSQFSAMLSSGVYTLIYQKFISGSTTEKFWIETTNLDHYSIKLLLITTLTSLTWLTVTFLTKKDDRIVTQKFKQHLFSNYHLKKSLYKALIFGASIILFLFFALKIIKNMW